MDREQGDLVCKDEVFAVVGCAMEVLNTLGHGLSEKPYENAMVVEFGLRAIPFVQQPRFDVTYKGVRVGEFIPDLIVFDGVVVDTKVVEKMTDHETGQMINYLKVTRLKVGVLLNFRHARLEWKRVVLEKKTANPRE